MEKIISIELFGQTFNFQADSDPEKAQEIADMIVREVTKVENEHKDHSQQVSRLAIMLSAALNIAHDRFDQNKNESKVLEEVSRRSTHLLNKLDHWMNANDTDRNQLVVGE